MPKDDYQEKTEPATPRRIQEAREEGKVARSQETSSLAILFFGVLALFFLLPGAITHLAMYCRYLFSHSGSMSFSTDSLRTFFTDGMANFAAVVGPIALVLAAVGFGINFLQVGALFSTKAIQPRFDKLNLANGFGRLFSKRSLFELLRDTVKLALIGVVGYYAVSVEFEHALPLADADAAAILTFFGAAAFRVALKICLILFILAVADFAYQRWDYAKSLRMSRQEVKEELKRTEGSPEVKGRVRRMQRDLAMARMMQSVPNADVVVTNPTEIAVALQYDAAKMAAPTVIAKGQRLIAQRIKEIAQEHKIPIVENKPLARALFKAVEVGMIIPENLYKAVAEVLAYVYRLKGKS